MENQNNDNKIILIDDKGNERHCEILFTYQHPETEKNYVVLYPVDEMNDDCEDAIELFTYSFVETEDGSGELFCLESDEEVEMINEVIEQFYQDQMEELDESDEE